MAQTKPKAGQFYGVSGNGTDGQFLQTDGTGNMAWADTTVDPTLTSIDYPGTTTAADPAGGESIIINGTGFQTGITCTIGGTSATTAFNSATQITITSPAKAAGQYTVAVTNTDGGNVSSANFIQYSGVPVWTTNSGSLGTVEEGGTTSFQVTATEGSDTIEYAVTSGSLPSGYSLATATGAITGTAPSVSADTTSTFSITATDDENQTSSARSFSITVTNIPPSNFTNTNLYVGNGSNAGSYPSIGGTLDVATDFTPDLVFVKSTDVATGWVVGDSVRGDYAYMYLNSTGGDGSACGGFGSNPCSGTYANGGIGTDTNKFIVKDNASGAYGVSGPGTNYVGYSFRAGGKPTATNSAGAGNSPTSGSVMIDGSASTTALAGNVQANKMSVSTALDFSIVQFTTSSGSTNEVPHGLSGTPDLFIFKRADSSGSWYAYTQLIDGSLDYLSLNNTDAKSDASETAPTATTVYQPTSTASREYMLYSFKSVPGISKVGTFTGDGTSSKLIETGFKVGWVMIKNTATTYRWYQLDIQRGGSSRLFVDDSAVASTTQETIRFLENGFEITTSDAEVNQSGSIMLYLAFAVDPSTTTPSLANSFNAVENTSPTTNQAIAAGFTPDMVWIKGSNIGSGNATSWGQYDTIRGGGVSLQSDNDGAQYDYNGHPSGDLGMAFTSTGYNTPPVVNNNVNNASDDYINYFWKAGGLGSINTDGTISSIVSANQAAGISIVKFSSSSSASTTVGHGLGASPGFIIAKRTDSTGNWATMAPAALGNGYMILNTNGQYQSGDASIWNNTAPTSSVFTTAGGSGTFFNAGNFIAYCFAPITNFSSIGTYTATGSAGTPTITTGFQPGWVLIKNVDRAQEWIIIDSVRGLNKSLQPESTAAEGVNGNIITTDATSFTIDVNGGGINYASGDTLLYMAFKIN